MNNRFSFARLPQARLFLADFSQGLGFLQHCQDLSAQKTAILSEMLAVAIILAAKDDFADDLTLQLVDPDFSGLVKVKKDGLKGFIKSVQAPNEHRLLIISQKARTSTLDCSKGIIAGFKDYLRHSENANVLLEVFCRFNKHNALSSCRLLYGELEKKDALPMNCQADYETALAELCLKKRLTVKKSLPLSFACDCSREKAKKTLLTLGKGTLEELFANDSALKVHCDFCNADYCFTKDDLFSPSLSQF